MEIETLFTTETGDALSRGLPPIVESPALRQVYEEANRASDGSVSVLILGEPGVGKKTLARWIHIHSHRARGPLVTLECVAGDIAVDIALFGCSRHVFVGFAGDRPSALVTADGGTVILNSVHSLPLGAQAKLLRTIETREVTRIGEVTSRPIDIRIVSTTSADLELAVRGRSFRTDLFHRLGQVTWRVPPLRERQAEIEPLARRFLSEAAPTNAPNFSVAVLNLFRSLVWPRNLTQLREVVVNAVGRCTGPEITPEHIDVATLAHERIPEPSNDAELPDSNLWTADQRAERARIVDALADAEGNATRAAVRLELSRRTLITKMDFYGISRPALAAYVRPREPGEK